MGQHPWAIPPRHAPGIQNPASPSARFRPRFPRARPRFALRFLLPWDGCEFICDRANPSRAPGRK